MPDIVQSPDALVNPPSDVAGPLPGAPIQPPAPPGMPAMPGVPAPTPPPAAAPVVSGSSSPNSAPADVDPQAVARSAVADATQANADQQKAADAAAKAEQEKNEADAKAAEAAAAEIRQRQEARDREAQASEQARGRLVELAEQADRDVGNFKFTDYEDTISTNKKIGLHIGAFLAGLGGSTDPLAQINRLTAQHFDRQKAELSSKENAARLRRQGIDDFDRHASDRRLYLEFQERNYREAIAKEIEARGLRSANPLAAARAQQLAAKVREEGDAKLVDMVGKYTQSEEARAHADLFRAKAAKARSAASGAGAQASLEEQLAQAAQDGKPYAELVKIAVKMRVKDPRKAAKEALEGAKLDESTILRDPDSGEPLGRAPGGKNVTKLAEDIANTRLYQREAEELADDIEKNGRILNPYSDAGKARLSKISHLQALGRQISGIQASDAGAKLEHEMIGGSGVGLQGIANPDALRKLARDSARRTEEKLKAGLTPLSGRKAPKVPPEIIEQAKTEVKRNGPHAESARKLLDQQGITVL